MARRPGEPKQGNVATGIVAIALASWFAAPVFAAPDRSSICPDNQEATLELPGHELNVAPVSHETSTSVTAKSVPADIDSVAEHHLLKPRVKATARKVFSDNVIETEAEESAEDDADESTVTKPDFRKVSDTGRLVPPKRQMYRRDI